MPETNGGLTAALAKVQAALPAIHKGQTAKVKGQTKSGQNYEYTYGYADLADISAAVLPLLGENGLAWVCKPTIVEGGAFVLEYRLRHVSGETEEGEYPLPDPARVGPQDLGGAITYARRYCLCAVVGVAPDDDDAQAAQAATRRPAPRSARPEPAAEPEAPAEGRPSPNGNGNGRRVPSEDAVKRMAEALGVPDPLNEPPKGMTIEPWAWQLAGEPDVDAVPWPKVAQASGVKQAELLERAQAFAAELDVPEVERPDRINDIRGATAERLRGWLLASGAPF